MIPKSFDQLGHTITVEHVDARDTSLVLLEADAFYCHSSKKIRIKASDQFTAESYKGAVFYHELAHCILEHAQRDDLSKDECLVDLLGDLLYQFAKTVKY